MQREPFDRLETATVVPPESAAVQVAFVIKNIVGRAGGAEKVLCNAANSLADAGCKVTLYHADLPGQPFFALRGAVDVISVRPKDRAKLPDTGNARQGKPQGAALRPYRFPRSAWTWWRQHGWWVRALRRFLRAHRPDVVIAFQPSATTDTLVAARGLGLPVIASLHNVPERDFERWERWDANPFDRWLRKRMLRHAARITVLLEEFRGWFPASVRERVVVLPNAVHVDGPAAAPGAAPAPGRRNTIIVVGRLAAAKDHATLVDAWALLHARHPDWQVEVFGSGPLKKPLAARIAERGVGRSFLLRGDTDQVMREYERAQLFCIPSLFEGFGLVTAEALSKGLPAVGFADCPGTNSLIRHGHNGLLADPRATGGDRARALADALDTLMNDAALRERLGAAGPASMRPYRPATIAAAWVALVDGVLPAAARATRRASPTS